MDKEKLLNILQPEIAKVDQTMRDDLADLAAQKLIPANLHEALEHALFNGGKRIRPLLCVLAGRLCNPAPANDLFSLAIAFEYLHVATLLHDDVIDHADTRRGRPTVNRAFGLPQAILTGDFLHARAMFLVGSLGGTPCLDRICRATAAMVSGEFLQLANVHNLNQAESDYFAVINGKTAVFIGAVCEIGAMYSGAGGSRADALRLYGANLGLAFQIRDDLLDYLGDETKTGKSVGNDFFEGKMTLPLIHALATGNEQDRQFLLDLLRGDKNDRQKNFSAARLIIQEIGGFAYAADLAEKLVHKGIDSLSVFAADQNHETVDILNGLAEYVVNREK